MRHLESTLAVQLTSTKKSVLICEQWCHVIQPFLGSNWLIDFRHFSWTKWSLWLWSNNKHQLLHHIIMQQNQKLGERDHIWQSTQRFPLPFECQMEMWNVSLECNGTVQSLGSLKIFMSLLSMCDNAEMNQEVFVVALLWTLWDVGMLGNLDVASSSSHPFFTWACRT